MGKWYRQGTRRGASTLAERLEWIREQWRRDPTIPVAGKGGMKDRCMEVFGCSPTASELTELHAKVAKGPIGQQFNPVIKPEVAASLRGLKDDFVKSAPWPKEPQLAVLEGGKLKVESMAQDKIPSSTTPTADSASSAKPTQTGGVSTSESRRAFAMEILKSNPDARTEDIQKAVKDRYGVGIDLKWLHQHLPQDRQRQTRRGETKGGIDERRAWALQLIQDNPSITAYRLMLDVKAKFGKSINHNWLAERITEARKREAGKTLAAPMPATVEDTIKAAVELIRSEVPNLRKLTIQVDEAGGVDFSWDCWERIVTSGRGKL